MCPTKSLRRPVPNLALSTVAPVDSKDCPTIARRICRPTALVVALFLCAHVHASSIAATVTPSGPRAASPAHVTHVAQVAPEKSAIPEKVLSKLDPAIVRALKKSRGELPSEKAAVLDPDIPIRDGPRVLVDIDATVSDELLREIDLAGGQLAPSPDAARVVRVMIPLADVPKLADRADVTFVSPTRLSIDRTLYAAPPAPAAPRSKP